MAYNIRPMPVEDCRVFVRWHEGIKGKLINRVGRLARLLRLFDPIAAQWPASVSEGGEWCRSGGGNHSLAGCNTW
jgi:hypothetical protein